MSIIERDYLPKPEKVVFPPGLALLIIRRAAAMAEEFEQKALDQLTRDARNAISRGAKPKDVVMQLRL
jgi:hypothetical protein